MKKTSFRTVFRAISAITLAVGMTLGSMSAALAVTLNANYQRISFNNTVKIGIDAPVGFSARYPGAVTIGGNVVDAIVSVVAKNNVNINNVDRVSTTDNWQIWSNLAIASGGGSATYNVAFVESGTSEPVTLQNMAIHVGDIDAKQYVQFSGVQSYTLANPTALTAQTGGSLPAGAFRFAEVNNAGDPTDQDPRFIAQVKYNQLSAVDIQIGSANGGAALFQLAFGTANWGSATLNETVVPQIVNYTVTYDENKPAGSGSGTVPGSSTAVGGTSQTIAGNTGTLVGPSGAAFLGWNTHEDGSGVMYQGGDSITPTTDVTLYAIYQQTFTLTYDGNGSTGGSVPAATTVAGAQTISAPGDMVRYGYAFLGWNTQQNGLGDPYRPGEVLFLEANVTLWAQWLADPVVPPDSPIDIPLSPGDPIGGSEVEYVVPDLDPGSDYTLGFEGNGENTELDAGIVDESGTAAGTGSFPETVPEGEYTLYFEGTDAEGDEVLIQKNFTVGPNGVLVSKQDGVTRTVKKLAKTGVESTPLLWVASVCAAVGLLVATGRLRRSRA